MYICMYVCKYVFIYVYVYIRMYVFMYVCRYSCIMYVFMYVFMHVCVYVCSTSSAVFLQICRISFSNICVILLLNCTLRLTGLHLIHIAAAAVF